MKKLINTLACAGLVFGSSLGIAAAQATTGDYVLTGMSGRVVSLSAKDFAVSTLATRPAAVHGVTMDAINYWNHVIEESTNDDHLLEVSPYSGYAGVIAKLPAAGTKTAVAVDVDGATIVASNDGTLYRVDRTTRAVTTIATGLGNVNALCIDGDTGDYIVGRWTERDLVRVDRTTKQPSVIAVSVGLVAGLAFHPHTGNFVVVGTTTPTLKLVDRQGQFVKAIDTNGRNAVAVDGATGDIVTAGFYNLSRYDKNLNLRFEKATGEIALGVSLYGARKVSAQGPFTKGSVCMIGLRFHDSANANYGGALVSMGMRPGLPIAGRKINANVNDRLFFLSAGGALEGLYTSGINGTLDSIGRATVRIVVPPFMPTGRKLYFVANAVNPTKPGNLDFGNTVVIPVQ